MPDNETDQNPDSNPKNQKNRHRFGANIFILYLSGIALSSLLLVLIPPHPIRIPAAIGSGFSIAMILYTILPR